MACSKCSFATDLSQLFLIMCNKSVFPQILILTPDFKAIFGGPYGNYWVLSDSFPQPFIKNSMGKLPLTTPLSNPSESLISLLLPCGI